MSPNWSAGRIVLAATCAALLALSCTGNNEWGSPTDGDGDGDADAECVDLDNDGYGTGCTSGPDCDDADPAHHNDCAHCLAGPAAGCTCSGEPPVECYDGPAGTAGVGRCHAGTRFCVDNVWQSCSGQTTVRHSGADHGPRRAERIGFRDRGVR